MLLTPWLTSDNIIRSLSANVSPPFILIRFLSRHFIAYLRPTIRNSYTVINTVLKYSVDYADRVISIHVRRRYERQYKTWWLGVVRGHSRTLENGNSTI